MMMAAAGLVASCAHDPLRTGGQLRTWSASYWWTCCAHDPLRSGLQAAGMAI